MRHSPRVLSPGILPRMVLKTRLLAAGSDLGLTKHGTSASQVAKAHIFETKQNPRYRPVGTLATIESLSWGKTSALHGIICNCGRSFMKGVFKFRTWETRIPLPITLKPNTSLRRNSLALFGGTSKYSAQSIRAPVGKNVGARTSAGSTLLLPIALPHTRN